MYYQVQIEKYCNNFENVAYSSHWHFDNLYHINSYNYTFCQLISCIFTSSTNFLKSFPEQFISFWFNEIRNSAKVIYLWKSDHGHTKGKWQAYRVCTNLPGIHLPQASDLNHLWGSNLHPNIQNLNRHMVSWKRLNNMHNAPSI